jgi:hypothetical protein
MGMHIGIINLYEDISSLDTLIVSKPTAKWDAY